MGSIPYCRGEFQCRRESVAARRSGFRSRSSWPWLDETTCVDHVMTNRTDSKRRCWSREKKTFLLWRLTGRHGRAVPFIIPFREPLDSSRSRSQESNKAFNGRTIALAADMKRCFCNDPLFMRIFPIFWLVMVWSNASPARAAPAGHELVDWHRNDRHCHCQQYCQQCWSRSVLRNAA